MASLYVMSLAELWAQSLTTPYYNTVNEEQNPNVTPWLTLEFETYTTEKDTYCNEWQEQGSIRLIWLGKAGNGFSSLFAIAESDVLNFSSNIDASGKLILETVNAPVEFGGSDTPFFGVMCLVDYVYRYKLT